VNGLAQRLRNHKKKLVALGVVIALPIAFHFGVAVSTHIEPPVVTVPQGEVREAGDLRTFGASYALHRGKILQVGLSGTPEEIGYSHARLLYREMTANEGTLYQQFEKYVPVAPLRWLLVDVSRLQFRAVDRGMPEERQHEIAAEALGFSPDPFAGFMPTYHRMVFLQSLYDIALSFEHSPLLGCTSFALTDGAAFEGHALLARNFDFEAGPIFDLGKAVFLVRQQGRIPYASVAWPGLVGAVSGMNAEGLALVVHGARAKEAAPQGEPVVHTMRDLLGRAKTTAEALDLLRTKVPMVPHMVMLVDASGDVAIVERVPGAEMFVRRGRGRVPLTNHLEGPLSSDPANLRVEQSTSTWPRRKRLDEILSNLPPAATVQDAVDVLRDKKGQGGGALALGDRRTLDALIATHGVVMDATAKALWVSEGPHLTGRFIQFDLTRLFASDYAPGAGPEIIATPADPIAESGEYDAWQRAGSPHHGAN
jgi:isopenicillin-N N-acyltransferase-like protein